MYWKTRSAVFRTIGFGILLVAISAGCQCGKNKEIHRWNGSQDDAAEETAIDTPAEDDEEWPEPEIGANGQWSQVRVGEDHYYYNRFSVQYNLHEGRGHELVAEGWDEESDDATVRLLQEQGWPIRSEFELPQQEFGENPNTGVQLRKSDVMEAWGFLAETGRVYDVEFNPENGTIAGKFEATLLRLRRPDQFEPREVEGAFRGALDVSCSYRTSETSWAMDFEYESEFCQQYEHLAEY